MIKILLTFSVAALSFAEDSRLVKAIHVGTVAEVQTYAKDPKQLNWKDSAGNDALFYAVSLNEFEKIKSLLDLNAPTKNLYSEKKESILFEATRQGSEKVLAVLIKKDPDIIKIKNIEEENPLFEAVRQNQSQAARYLIKKGISLKEKNKSGKTPADYIDPKNKKMSLLFKEFKLTK